MGGPRAAGRAVTLAVIATVLAVPACDGGRPTREGTTVPQAGPTATVKIGFIGALTGPSAALGTGIVAGEKLAVSQFDAVDPPVRISLDVVDTGGDPSRARSGALRLVADRVVAVIGPTFGDEAAAADPVLEQAGIPSVTVSAADRDLAARGWRYFHRLIPDDALQGQAIGGFLSKNLRANTVAVLDDSVASSRSLAVSVAEAVSGAGATVLSSDHLDARPGGIDSAVRTVMGESPQAVFFAGTAGAAARLATGLRSAGFAGKFLVGGPGIVGYAGASGTSAAEGTYLACGCAGTDQNPDAQAFNAAYLAQFGSGPGPYAAEAYDATNAILQAVKSGDITPAAINGFLATVDYTGITRTVRFVPDGDWVGSTTYLYKVESGQAVQIASFGQS